MVILKTSHSSLLRPTESLNRQSNSEVNYVHNTTVGDFEFSSCFASSKKL